MTAQRKDSIVLLIHCKDRKGIVARVSGFIHDFGGNILDSDHHTDEETNDFLMRMEFSTEGLQIPPDEISAAFAPIAKIFEMRYEVHHSSHRTRVGMLVSNEVVRDPRVLQEARSFARAGQGRGASEEVG